MQTTSEAVAFLAANTLNLPADKQEFARSLVRQFGRYGALSDKQVSCALRLARQAAGEPEPEKAKVEGLGGLIELFDTAHAKGKLKWPKLTFDAEAVGVPLQLSRAGENARQPGSVNCTDGGRYGSNQWWGRVERSGTFVASDSCPPELREFLAKLATDTANVAAMYGRKTGNCCFCGTALNDARSIEVGYGPVCSKKWGMPWGVKAKAAAQADLLAA